MSPNWTAKPSLACRTTVPRNTVSKEPTKKENRNRIAVWIAIDLEAWSIRTPETDTFSVTPLPIYIWESAYSVGT